MNQNIKSYNDSYANSTSNADYYNALMNLSYKKIVESLLEKYGKAEHDYFCTPSCKSKNPKVKRTSEGLYCHHIDEDKVARLSSTIIAASNPFEYQKADRLIYCNLLEHLILHIKIAEEANKKDLGIRGVFMISGELNDIYAGKPNTEKWKEKIICVVKNDYETYIKLLKRITKFICKNSKYDENDIYSKLSHGSNRNNGSNPVFYEKIFVDLLKNKFNDN